MLSMGEVDELRSAIVGIKDALYADLQDGDGAIGRMAALFAVVRLDWLAAKLRQQMDDEDAGQMAAAGLE